MSRPSSLAPEVLVSADNGSDARGDGGKAYVQVTGSEGSGLEHGGQYFWVAAWSRGND